MQTTIPLYGFGGGGGTGAALTVNAPAGCTVTVSKDGKTKTKVAGADGVAVFKGLATGEWTLTINEGSQTASKPVMITADYSTAITFFAATIHVTYPAGSTCTATDGVTALTAPDTRGTWDCVVPNAGTWTVSLDSGFSETVTITGNGETASINKWHIYHNGDACTPVTGGWGPIKTGNGGSVTFDSDSITFKNTQREGYAYAKPLNFSPELLSRFSVLKANIKSYNTLSSNNYGSLAIYEDLSAEQVAYARISKIGISSLSLSGINGYPALRTYGASMKVTEYWLEV